jgi:endonuclease VIII
MPEGDSLHRAAERLQVLVGERVEVETPHPRAAVKGLAQRLGGRRLERVEAVGKNLLLRFEGGLLLRSHLRMKGRWRVERRGTTRAGKPWLVLRGAEYEAVLWNGSVLELVRDRAAPGRETWGLDILGEPPDFETMLARLRGVWQEREIGDAILDQRLVAGIGNLWKAEALWEARISPWRRLDELADEELRTVLESAHRLMRAAVHGPRPPRHVYRRRGHACPRCGGIVRSAPQGDHVRTAYWCPGCQVGGSAPPS